MIRAITKNSSLSILLITLMPAMGCVHRTVSQDFGLPARTISQRLTKKAASPDAALRAIFQQQTQGAFNPLTDDRRVQTIQTRLKLDPNDVAARLELAGIYESYGLHDDAFDQYIEALKVNPSEPAALGLAYF